MMNKHSLLSVAALALCAGLVGGAIASRLSAPWTVTAEAAQEIKRKAQRWEHCSVGPVNGATVDAGKVTGSAMIFYIRAGGYQAERIDATITQGQGAAQQSWEEVQDSALAKAVAKLGEEGWELVGEGTLSPRLDNQRKALYFRRPRP